MAAELAFLGYLREHGYGAAVPVPARNGDLLVTRPTPWGEHVASAFEAVPGTQLSRGDLSDSRPLRFRDRQRLFRCGGRPVLAIDFDDAMYHWFAMDIEQAVASLADDASPADAAARVVAFLAGYASGRPLPPDLASLRRVCRRFASLYWYVRVRRSLHEALPDEPDWMTGLRHRLADGLAERAANFGIEFA